MAEHSRSGCLLSLDKITQPEGHLEYCSIFSRILEHLNPRHHHLCIAQEPSPSVTHIYRARQHQTPPFCPPQSRLITCSHPKCPQTHQDLYGVPTVSTPHLSRRNIIPELSGVERLRSASPSRAQSQPASPSGPLAPTPHVTSPPSPPRVPAVGALSLSFLASNVSVSPAPVALSWPELPKVAQVPPATPAPHSAIPPPPPCVPAIGTSCKDPLTSNAAISTALFVSDRPHLHQLALPLNLYLRRLSTAKHASPSILSVFQGL
jgi:hypothetical protein